MYTFFFLYTWLNKFIYTLYCKMGTLKPLPQTLQYLLNFSFIPMIKDISIKFCCHVTICFSKNKKYIACRIKCTYNFSTCNLS